MSLQKPFPYSPSFGAHIIIAILLGTTLSFILIVLEPVGISDMTGFFGDAKKAGYGITIAVGYLISHYVSNRYFLKTHQWTWGDELVFQVSSGLFGITLAYLYHDSIINEQSFSLTMYLGFLLYLALPIFPLLVTPVFLLRYFLVSSTGISNGKKEFQVEHKSGIEYLNLNGKNQKDGLIVAKNSILYAKSVENYVQLFYLGDSGVESKIFRSTLAEFVEQAGFMVQTHRSYLLNPLQPFLLKGNSQKSELIHETLGEPIPVSRSHYAKVKISLSTIPKG